jgi:hypothetical protein
MKDEFRVGPHRPGKGPFPKEVEGTVSQYLLNPRGEVDGLLLDPWQRFSGSSPCDDRTCRSAPGVF